MTSERANGYILKRRRYDRIRHNGITTTKYLINQHRERRQLGGIATSMERPQMTYRKCRTASSTSR